MKPALLTAAGLMLICSVSGVEAQKKAPKKAAVPAGPRPAMAKQQNQFVTVEEYIRSRMPAGVAVSVEGYAALGYRMGDGSVRLYILDSVDHILSASDANASSAGAAVAVIPPSVIRTRPAWGWTTKGAMRMPMFTGNGTAQRQLRDVAPKIRVTGWTASGRATVNPVTKVEITNENGEYVLLK